MTQIIELKDIVRRFQVGDETVEALRKVNLSVEEGEFLGVLGPSGSGKSTLMNIIGCMDDFDEGEYNLLGIPIKEMNEEQLTIVRNRLIGFVFQRYHLINKYTVLQNVMMPLLARGERYGEAAESAARTLDMLGLAARMKHKPNELSGGQQQRVAIARALVGEPKLLLADEPTGALDTKTGREVLALFQQLNDMGHTIVMITHDLKVAESARRIVHIIDGELKED